VDKTYWRDAQHVNTVLDFNTRFYSDVPPKNFRYHYPPVANSVKRAIANQ